MSIKLQALITKELKEYLTTPLFYLLIGPSLALLGWFFFQQLVIAREQSQLQLTWDHLLLIPYLGNINFIYILMIPLLTMKSLSSEIKDGTLLSLLQTKLSEFHIVLGKFLALGLIILIFQLVTLVFPIMIALSSSFYWPHFIVGFFGVYVHGLALVSIGLFCSSLGSNQIIGAFLSFIFIMLLMAISSAGIFWESFGISYHLEYLIQGLLRPIEIAYYCSFIFIMLYLTIIKLQLRLVLI